MDRRFVVAALLLPCIAAACAEVELEPSPSMEVESQALTGPYEENSNCSPFRIALMDRSLFYGRTVANSNAFRSCVKNTMQARYWNCSDAYENSSLANEIAAALAIFRNFGHKIRVVCSSAFGSMAANYGPYGGEGERTMITYSQYDASFGDWDTLYGVEPGTGYQPWQWRAADIVHEHSHTHGYKHVGSCSGGQGPGEDWGNPNLVDCADPSCTWTSTCGGPGVPPSGMTQATAGESQREFCSFRHSGQDNQYNASSPRSVPYILSSCAEAVVKASHARCGKASQSCREGEQLRLLTSWSGQFDNQQPQNASCSCVADPRHVVSLRSQSGHYLTAVNGGGDEIRTNWTQDRGAWQMFWLNDRNGGELMPGDWVNIQTHGGKFWNHIFKAISNAAVAIKLDGNPLTGRIKQGSTVRLSSKLNASTPKLVARDNGSKLVPAFMAQQAAEFDVMEPRRDTLVYLKSHHGRYLEMRGGGAVNKLGAAALDFMSPNLRRRSAFWMVDHNGGTLRSGDWISLESLSHSMHFLSAPTSSSDTAQATLSNVMSSSSHFHLEKQGGSSGLALRHGDVVALKNADGKYLTAMPTGPHNQKVYYYSTFVGAWQKFTVDLVSKHDKARPTW